LPAGGLGFSRSGNKKRSTYIAEDRPPNPATNTLVGETNPSNIFVLLDLDISVVVAEFNALGFDALF